MTITYGWRAGFDGATLDALHAAGFGTEPRATDQPPQAQEPRATDQPPRSQEPRATDEPPRAEGPRETDRAARVRRHSLGWVCAYAGERLVGFVNVPWDGGEHAFLVDTVVAADARGAGVGTRLVAVAAAEARRAGCRWLHVDFLPELSAFYLRACGFRPTAAGLLALEKGP